MAAVCLVVKTKANLREFLCETSTKFDNTLLAENQNKESRSEHNTIDIY